MNVSIRLSSALWRRPLMLLLLLAASASAVAATPTTCIPFGFGGAYAPGPPQWFQATGANFARFNTWVDDPRWSGAAAIDLGGGTTPEVQFRALYNPASGAGQFVYLSWWHKAALNPTATHNVLYVGVRPTGATTGLLLRIELTSNSPAAASAGGITTKVSIVDAAGNFPAALNPTPAWTNDIRAWVEQVTDQTTLNPAQATNTTEPNNWAIHVRLPMGVNLGDAANNVTLGTPFNMWYELLQGTPTAQVIAYTWPPTTASENFYVTGLVEQLPAPNRWPEFSLGGASCKGATIDGSGIGVTYPGSASTVEINKNAANTFTAVVTNKSGAAAPSDAVHARFRIANWGAQVTTLEAIPGSANWNTVRGLGDISLAAGSTVADGATWTITAPPWQPLNTNADEAGFFNGTKSPHQCIQVELSGPGPLTFLQSSAFTNMRVVPASVFEEAAEVSVVGLPNAATAKRDVFLHIQKENMPADVTTVPDGGQTPPTDGGNPKPPTDQPPVDRPNGDGGPNGQPADPTRPPAVRTHDTADGPPATGGDQTTDPAQQAAEEERDRVNDLTEFERRIAKEPAYLVRAYHDTGLSVTLEGKAHPILQPMVSFGYLVDHKGALVGWDTQLGGAEKLADDYYRIGVPNNGAEKIQIRIEARETNDHGGTGPDPLRWVKWFVLAVVLLVVLVWLFRRKASSP